MFYLKIKKKIESRKCLKVPLCSNCSTHNQIECNFFQKSKIGQDFLLDNFDVISPIRVLLLGLNELEQYEKFMKMPAHLNERRGTDVWDFCEKRIVNPLINSEIFCNFPEQPDSELIQKICGILDVYSFQIRGPALIQVIQVSKTFLLNSMKTFRDTQKETTSEEFSQIVQL